MSKALECNRCGQCFVPKNIKNDETFIKIEDLVWFDAKGYSGGCVYERYRDIHLCPICSDMMVLFFNGGAIPELQDSTQKNRFFDRTEAVVRRY